MVRAKAVFPELAEMLRRVLGDLVDQSSGDFLDLFAEDGAMEFPYALPGWPKRVVGHADLAAYLEPLTDVFTITAMGEPTVHRTQEPNVAILEFSVTGRTTATGKSFDQSYVEVITVEDRKIKAYRDYWNPMVVQDLSA